MHSKAQQRAIGTIAAAVCLLIYFPVANASLSVHGEIVTCSDFISFDHALDRPGSLYFKGWTSKDFDNAESWVASCFAAPPSKADKEREGLLAQRRDLVASNGELARNDKAADEERAANAAEAANDEAVRRTQETERRTQADSERVQRAAYDQCARSDDYRRYLTGTRVLEAFDRAQAAHELLARQKQIEDQSEIVDKYEKRSAGEYLVDAQIELRQRWLAYKAAGGAAQSPTAIARPLRDPCEH
jgi:hypothetical protein